MNKENYFKVQQLILVALGTCLFLKYEYIKVLVPIVIIDLIIRKLVFKEKLDCGNETIKKFIIWFIIIGIFWNFLAGMSYKPARNFIKIHRYIPFLFFLYPLFKKSEKNVSIFLFCSLTSYLVLLTTVIKQFLDLPWVRANGFEGISTTGNIGAMVALFSFGMFLKEEKTIKKIVYILIYISGVFIVIVTQGRAPLLSIIIGTFILLCLELYSKLNIKKIILTILSIIFIVILGLKIIPKSNLDRFKTTFNTEKTVGNTSNGLRLEMWKIGLKRIKENPILGSGTKYDEENHFKRFARELPEKTNVEKKYKRALLNGFNDAHNMYINAIVDNGIYTIGLFIIWFIIPAYTLLNYRESKLNKYFLGSIGGIISILVIGCFWMLWRTPDQLYFWILYAIMFYGVYGKLESN